MLCSDTMCYANGVCVISARVEEEGAVVGRREDEYNC